MRKILIVGSGGREHALVHALRRGARPLELPFVFSTSMTWEDLGPLADALDPVLEPA